MTTSIIGFPTNREHRELKFATENTSVRKSALKSFKQTAKEPALNTGA